jgi:adenylate cyclase
VVPAVALGRVAALTILLALLGLRAMDPVPVEELRLRIFDSYQRLAPRPPSDCSRSSSSTSTNRAWPNSGNGRGRGPGWPNWSTPSPGPAPRPSPSTSCWPKPDRTSPLEMARVLVQLDDDGAQQARNARQQRRSAGPGAGQNPWWWSGAVGLHPEDRARAVPGEAADEAQVGILGPDPRPFLVSFPELLQNVPEIERAATGKGPVQHARRPDGVVRRVPAIMTAGGKLKPALASSCCGSPADRTRYLLRTSSNGIESLSFGDVTIPTDANGRVWLRYNGHDPERFVSARDVLEGRGEALQALAGKLVLIGTSAVGLLDIKTTPVDAAMPGVEVHAQLLENLLSGTLLHRPGYAWGRRW